MRHRVSLREPVELLLRDGTAIGKLVGLTLDLADRFELAAVGGKGGVEGMEALGDNPNAEGGSPRGDRKLFDAPAPEALIWEHYQRTVDGGERLRFDAKRKRVIRRALDVRSIEQCCLAIDWLAQSPHHNGQNDRHEKYLDIRYALGLPSESPDERIDKMSAKAPNSRMPGSNLAAVLAHIPSGQREMVQSRMRDVRWMVENPGDETLAARGEESLRLLRETPAIGIEPVVENGHIIDWRRAT